MYLIMRMLMIVVCAYFDQFVCATLTCSKEIPSFTPFRPIQLLALSRPLLCECWCDGTLLERIGCGVWSVGSHIVMAVSGPEKQTDVVSAR